MVGRGEALQPVEGRDIVQVTAVTEKHVWTSCTIPVVYNHNSSPQGRRTELFKESRFKWVFFSKRFLLF